MTKFAVLVHGFNVKDGGASTIGRLDEWLTFQGCIVERFIYPRIGLFGARSRNDELANKLCGFVNALPARKGDTITLYCHSNGATLAYLMTKHFLYRALSSNGIHLNLVLINPALEREVTFSSNIDQIRVFYSEDDTPVKWGHALRRFLGWFGLEATWRPWGDMGRYGYRGPIDLRVQSSSHRSATPGFGGEIGHSGCFKITACKRAIVLSI